MIAAPNTGALRLTKEDGDDTAFDGAQFEDNFSDCTSGTKDGKAAGDLYNIAGDAQDCGQTFLY